MSATDSLFASFALKSLHTDNRIVMAPMTRGMSPDNKPTDASVDYYRRRAAGGVGLIITEGTCPNHIAASGYENVPYFHGDDRLAGKHALFEVAILLSVQILLAFGLKVISHMLSQVSKVSVKLTWVCTNNIIDEESEEFLLPR